MPEKNTSKNTLANLFQPIKNIEKDVLIGAVSLLGIFVALVVVYLLFFAPEDITEPEGEYLEFAKEHARGAEYVEIIRNAQGALKNDNVADDAGAYLDLGFYKNELGDTKGAIAAYKEGIEKFPTHQVMLSNLAHVYENVKEYDKAEEYYKRVIGANPRNVRIIIDLANLYRFYFTGREGEILKLVEADGLFANPDNPDLWGYLANFYRYQLNDKNKAVEYYQKILAVTPNDEATQAELRNLLRQQ